MAAVAAGVAEEDTSIDVETAFHWYGSILVLKKTMWSSGRSAVSRAPVATSRGNTSNLFSHLKRCLEVTYFPGDHTGENKAAGLREGLSSWDLDEEQQVSITTDNATNMVLSAQLNGWMRLQCFGHRLHLAMENALKDERVSRATGLCRKLVGHFSHSWKKRQP